MSLKNFGDVPSAFRIPHCQVETVSSLSSLRERKDCGAAAKVDRPPSVKLRYFCHPASLAAEVAASSTSA